MKHKNLFTVILALATLLSSLAYSELRFTCGPNIDYLIHREFHEEITTVIKNEYTMGGLYLEIERYQPCSWYMNINGDISSAELIAAYAYIDSDGTFAITSSHITEIFGKASAVTGYSFTCDWTSCATITPYVGGGFFYFGDKFLNYKWPELIVGGKFEKQIFHNLSFALDGKLALPFNITAHEGITKRDFHVNKATVHIEIGMPITYRHNIPYSCFDSLVITPFYSYRPVDISDVINVNGTLTYLPKLEIHRVGLKVGIRATF